MPAVKPFSIPLNAGWNIIGFPHTDAIDGKTVVQQLIDRGTLIKVQDELGNSIEDFGIFGGWTNNIGNFMPGEGYKVKVSANEILTFYDSYAKSLTIMVPVIPPAHFKMVTKGNGVDHMNINLVDIPENLLQSGDEIGVFDGNLCAGAIKFDAESSGFIISYSDLVTISIPVTANDNIGGQGFVEGNSFTLKLWKEKPILSTGLHLRS